MLNAILNGITAFVGGAVGTSAGHTIYDLGKDLYRSYVDPYPSEQSNCEEEIKK